MQYNKLVRDNIPEIIIANGETATFHIASEKEYEKALVAKLQEEVDEYKQDASTNELVDIIEVVYALCDIHGVSIEDLENIRKQKNEKRGAFTKKIILEETN